MIVPARNLSEEFVDGLQPPWMTANVTRVFSWLMIWMGYHRNLLADRLSGASGGSPVETIGSFYDIDVSRIREPSRFGVISSSEQLQNPNPNGPASRFTIL